jgi:NADPH-dependent glutamate synthase beta subunit-like oxidoreductase/coenzyme F420-reducing hydrogenase beta subunit
MYKLAPPCRVACPAGINVQEYISLIAGGQVEEALAVIREDNPFPSVCGRVCTRPCEAECERGRIDEPVAINALKLYAARRGMEAGACGAGPVPAEHEEKVAVIGSGPAGLSAAYFLARRGYPVTVFEAMPEPGGKLRVCLPAYRLPREELDADIGYIRDLGVTIRTNAAFGRDFTFEDLQTEGFKAFFVATGAHRNRTLGVPGEDLAGVLYALDFLRDVCLGHPVNPGRNVAIIGGGNAAVEAARVALRLGAEVQAFSILPRKESPADPEFLKQAEMEGAVFQFSVRPTRFVGEDGRARGVELVRTRQGAPDELGRKTPVSLEGSEFRIEVDTVIIAIGEEPAEIPWPKGIEVSRRGMPSVDPSTLRTGLPNVFAGGDVVTGTSSVVEAIGAGKRAAAHIDAHLRGTRVQSVQMVRHAPDLPKEVRNPRGRNPMPELPPEHRKGNFLPVELGFSTEAAVAEAGRCLRCGSFASLLYGEVISKGLCTACGACIGVCPNESVAMNGVVPELTGACGGCGSCYQACPGKEIRIQELDRRISGRARRPDEKRIGIHIACYAAHATDPAVRRNATSGGVITALLMYAFDKGLIDAALVTSMSEENPLRPAPMIATCREDLVKSQKTKYMLVPGGLLSILRRAVVEKGFERLAVVGSPCHIHAVRKIQTGTNKYLRTQIGARIRYAIGHNCAFNFYPEGTDTMIQALGLKAEEIASIGWRDTSEVPFPGQFCAVTRSGEKRSMPLLQEYVILGAIYDHPRCRICYDWANEVSDISSGDEVDGTGFHKPGAQRSHTVVRTSVGEALFSAAAADGYLEAEPVTEDAVARNLGFIIKKVGNIPRIEEAKRLGLPLPNYGNFPFF